MTSFWLFAIAAQLWTGWSLKDLIAWLRGLFDKSKDVAVAAKDAAKTEKK